MEKFTPEQLKGQTTQAQEKIQAGNADLEAIRDYVQNNLPDLIAQASQDYQQEMQGKIEKAVQEKDFAKTKELIEQVQSHIENAVEHGLTPEQIQQFTTEYDTFWKDTYKTWRSRPDTSQMQFTPEFKSPKEINFKDLAEQPKDTKEFGKYLTNPETVLLDYESLGEPIIFNPNTDVGYQSWLQKNNRGGTVASMMDYIHETYAEDHHIPGIEYQKYLFENQEKIPASLKDTNWYRFPGSAFRGSDGDWWSLSGRWDEGGEWLRSGSGGMRYGWNSRDRVALFKKNIPKQEAVSSKDQE